MSDIMHYTRFSEKHKIWNLLCSMFELFPYFTKSNIGCLVVSLRLDGLSTYVYKYWLLCGCSISRWCNIFIGCKPCGRIPHTVQKTDHTSSYVISHRGITDGVFASKSGGRVRIPPKTIFYHMVLPTLAHAVGTELSPPSFCREDISNVAQPCLAMRQGDI